MLEGHKPRAQMHGISSHKLLHCRLLIKTQPGQLLQQQAAYCAAGHDRGGCMCKVSAVLQLDMQTILF